MLKNQQQKCAIYAKDFSLLVCPLDEHYGQQKKKRQEWVFPWHLFTWHKKLKDEKKEKWRKVQIFFWQFKCHFLFQSGW